MFLVRILHKRLMAIIRAQQGTFYVSGKKCVLCQAPLSHAHRDRRHIICGPGGNYCNHFNNDVHLRSRIGDARFETFRALGVKERWRHRRPRAIASEHCHYVLITGILPDTTGHNLEVIGNCSRLQQALEKISQWYRERPNQQDLALPYSLFHRHGYPEAVVAFEDRGFAELVVAIISRDR